MYAIDQLDRMSLLTLDDDEWSRTHDFNRRTVLTVLLPLTTNSSELIASRALKCFVTESNASAVLEPFTGSLVEVANGGATSRKRLNAIYALSGLENNAVSNSVAQLLKDPDENIRVEAVRLLPRFPAVFAEQSLRERADDDSANVRSVVADVIGDEKYERCLPVLVKLFSDPVGRDKLIPPTTISYLQAGQRWSNIGDVHTAAGYALVKFAPTQVSEILKSNLNDPGFHINFVAKLAQGEPEPWLPELVSILEARHAYVDDVLKSPWNDPRRFADPQADRILIGTYTKCWEDIRQYLLKKSPEELASGEFDRYMDLLEKTVQPVQGGAIQETHWLYQLYRSKNLAKRVGNLRNQYDKTESWWFDDFDRRGDDSQVFPIDF